MNNIDYYKNNYKKYWIDTFKIKSKSFDDIKNFFIVSIKNLQKRDRNATRKILDVGFGSGRDVLDFYHANIGKIYGIDACSEFIDEFYKNIPYIKRDNIFLEEKLLNEINYNEEFDGVWCCMVLLHCKNDNDFSETFEKIIKSIIKGGFFYFSFKRNIESNDERTFYIPNDKLLESLFKKYNMKVKINLKTQKYGSSEIVDNYILERG